MADRFIELCGGLSDREMDVQILDTLDIERERGITIKAQSVTLHYDSKDGRRYQLNFIDTPGHVDFTYEVSRSLAACEGALLLVDAGQGVEAQSVATCYTAIEQGLEVLPVLNKMDLPQAEPERVRLEIEEIIGIDASEAVCASAKTGMGIAHWRPELCAGQYRLPGSGAACAQPCPADRRTWTVAGPDRRRRRRVVRSERHRRCVRRGATHLWPESRSRRRRRSRGLRPGRW